MEQETSEESLDENGQFSSKKMVYYLENVGSNVLYSKNVTERGKLPPYFQETKFTKAQEVFKKYKANLCIAQLIGLVMLLSHPKAIQIIMMTNRSSEPSTARTRYRNTLRHVFVWYEYDFIEDSNLWKSIYRVRQMHHAANLQAKKHPGIQQITQFELAVTIFGFIGFAIIRPDRFGLDDLTEEELEALIHFWRIIGYLMGVEDRFNICRDSVKETKDIFEGFMEIHCKPHVILRDPDSLQMQFAAIQGISEFMLPLDPKSILNFAYELIISDPVERSAVEFSLSISQGFYTFVFKRVLKNLRYEYLRNTLNYFIDRRMSESTS